MAITMQQVRKALDVEEPDYEAATAQLGSDALPHLETLIKKGDPMLASKAAYLAGLIPHERALDVVKMAAQSDQTVVRVAAAAAAQGLSGSDAAAVLSPLLGDSDPGVRKVALNSVQADTSHEVHDAVEQLMQSDLSPALQDTARRALDRLTFRDRVPQAASEALDGGDGTGMGGGSIGAELSRALDQDAQLGVGQGGGSIPGQAGVQRLMDSDDTPENADRAGRGGGSIDGTTSPSADVILGRGEGGGSVN